MSARAGPTSPSCHLVLASQALAIAPVSWPKRNPASRSRSESQMLSASTKFACASIESPWKRHVDPSRRRPTPHSVIRASRWNLVEALSIYDPERDREARFRFGRDTGVTARAYLAITKWQLGEVGSARALIEEAVAHAIETGHVPTLVNTYVFKAQFEMVRGNAGAARRDAEIVVELGQANALTLFTATGALQSAWASARLDGGETRATEHRRALAAYTNQGNKQFVPFSQGLLAEIEAQGDAEGALTRIDEALVLAGETGERWSDAFLHRLRGEILLKRDPANPVPAEDALLTAIAIAQQQKARSFELRAALSLAKLYHSTDRPAEAHAVLASALKGFSPTPEFPEIAEAQTLLAAL